MKKLVIVLFVFSLAYVLNGQNDPVNEIFAKYSGIEGFTTVDISGDMFKMLAQLDSEDKDLEKFSKLSHVKVLAQEGKTAELESLNFYNEIYKKLDKTLYKELLIVKEKDENVNILVRDDEGHISEFLIIVSGAGENVLVSIRGEIDFDDLDDISGTFNLKCPDNMKLMGKNHN